MFLKCFWSLLILSLLVSGQNITDNTNQASKPKIWATDDVNSLPEYRKITSPIHPYIKEREGGNQQILTPIPLPEARPNFFRPKSKIERWQIEGGQTFRAPKENLYVKGELVIQFNEEGRAKLKIGKSTTGVVITGISAVDQLNIKYNAYEMMRVIKDEDLPPKAKEYRLDLIYLLKVDESLDLERVAKDYRAIPEVKGCSPNYYGYKCNIPKTYPDDPYFDWAPNITQGPEVWTLTQGNSTDTIAILDIEQFNTAHPDLNNNWAGTGSNEAGYPYNGTSSWHGTGCAGHACAELNNSAGISGSAGGWASVKGILWLPYRFVTLAGNINGITYAVNNGACVISQSIAFSGNVAALEDAFANALANDVLSFAAAGNENNSSLGYPAPAMFSCVVAVGGINNLDRHWAWSADAGSNYGSHIDVVAPGDLHWSCTATGYTDQYGGTSWATPRAAAIAALVANYRNIRGQALKEVIERTADEIEYLTDNSFPWHPPSQGLMGSGRVNAYEAVMSYNRNISTNWIAASSNNVPYINCKNMYLDFDARDSLHGKHSHSLVPFVPTRVRAMVQNRGKQTESFYVTCVVESSGVRIFQNRKLVTGLASSKAQIVEFEPFRVGRENFDYRINVFTELDEDYNPRNDTFGITVRSTRSDTVQYDVGDWDIAYSDPWAAWAVKFNPERTCTLKAVQFMIYAGGTACSLIVWEDKGGRPGARIMTPQAYTPPGGPSWNTVALTSPVLINRTVWVGFKTPGSGGGNVAPCVDRRSNAGMSYYSASGGSSSATDWTSLGEDLLFRPIVSYQSVYTNDVAMKSINSPPASVVKGVTQLPQATVTNVGSAANSFNATCRIDSSGVNRYSSTKSVSSLNPGDTARVIFDPWTPNWEGGTY
ncbi:MAG: S8 family serine peptidase, partial [candidate division WOR-3 bacterium]